jgi:hypothetical protein
MSRPLYPQGKSPRYPLDTRLGKPQRRSGRHGKKKILDPTGIRNPTTVVQSVAGRSTDCDIPAPFEKEINVLNVYLNE